MSRRRPSDDELQSMLAEGHFGEGFDLPRADPVVTMPMVLLIAEIDAYERNPRQDRNPLHEEIKDSIRHQGLQQPLVVTRRPGNERYVVKAGGNTRLAVLRELHEETGEERFVRIHVLFEPWSRESEVLTAHLIENDTRGELSFIDKARAVRDLKNLIESETGEVLTHEHLAVALRDRGYRLERSILSRIDYAVDVLLPRIPEALRAGVGQPQIQNIRRLERAARRIWVAQELGPGPDFEEVFAALLGRYDGVEWQLERFRRALEKEIAERSGEELPRISLEVDAVMAGHPPSEKREIPEPQPVPTVPQPPGNSQTAADERAPPRFADSSPPGASRGSPASSESNGDLPPAPSSPGGESGVAGTTPAAGQEATVADADGRPVGGVSIPTDPKSLRARAWVLASRIAKRNAMGDIVTPLGNHGAGFLVDFVYTGEEDDAQTKLARATLWWFLATVAEQFHGPPDAVAGVVPQAWSGKPIAQVISDPDNARHGELLAEFALIDFGSLMGPLVFARIDDRDWADLLDLLDAYRRLKRSVGTTASLWLAET